MGQIFEALMILSFGAAWPISILKSIKSKTTKGKSIIFLYVVFFGYIFGIISKFTAGKLNYVLIFYFINISMVMIDLIIYYRNLVIYDKKADKI